MLQLHVSQPVQRWCVQVSAVACRSQTCTHTVGTVCKPLVLQEVYLPS